MTSRRVKEVSVVDTMSEAQLQDVIIQAAHQFGYRVAHFRPALVKVGGQLVYRTPVSADGKGFFDLILSKPGRLIAVECKSEKGKLSPEQIEWLEAVKGACECYVFRPSDWLDNTIINELSGMTIDSTS